MQDCNSDRPLDRFVELYEALNKDRSWWGDVNSLRFAAITALHCPGSGLEVATAIRDVAEDLRQRASWFTQLRGPLNFVISAMLLRMGDTPEAFLAEADRVQSMFRQLGMRRGYIYEMLAILVLRQRGKGAPITREMTTRFQKLYEEMKCHHWWLTGPDDFPACAVLVQEEGSAAEIGETIEGIYQALAGQGFSTGNQLQFAANMLYLAHQDPTLIAQRYRALADAFRAKDVSIWRSDYDELAFLSFLKQSPEEVVSRTLQHRKAMAQLKPKPDVFMTFSLAAAITFIELVTMDDKMQVITEARPLMDMQTIIAAQEAVAVIAAVSGAAAAGAASG